jgi:hypothetical protein
VVIGVYEGYDIETIMGSSRRSFTSRSCSTTSPTARSSRQDRRLEGPGHRRLHLRLSARQRALRCRLTLPAELAKRGVKIAISSADAGGPVSSHSSRNLPYAAGFAVAYGLPYDEALKAITLNPAEMFGFGDKLGSLDVGKTANVVSPTATRSTSAPT